jgi:tetratricopeptide (TPR) repeat protein
MNPTPPAAPHDGAGPASPPTPPPRRRVLGVLRPVRAALGAARRQPRRTLAILLLLAVIAFGIGLTGAQIWAVYHFRAARSALARYHVTEAGNHLEACLKIWPNDPDVLFLAARSARCAGLFDEADDFLNRYQEQRGRDDDVVLERALLTAERGDVDDVLKFCVARVEANDPASPLILEAVARGCLRAYPYRLNDANWALQTWLKREPDNPMALLLRGHLDHERYADTDAAAAFRRALEIDPDLDEARDRLTQLLLGIVQPAEARPHLEYLRRRRPNDPLVVVRLAQCLNLLGKQEEAIRLLDELLVRYPGFGPALGIRGKLALDAGQYAEAESWLRQAHERTPWDASLLPLLQKCLSQSGQTDKAQALEPQVKQTKEDLERLDGLLGQGQNKLNNVDVQYEAGVILLRIGAYDEGLRRLEHATQLDPRHVKAHEALADFYQRTGDSLKAAKHQRLAKAAAAPGS